MRGRVGQPPRFTYSAGEAEPTRVTVVTEVTDCDGAPAAATGRSLLTQSLQAWEWVVVTVGEAVPAPLDDTRVRVTADTSRARALRQAAAGAAEFVVVVDAGHLLAPTTLEQWVWYLTTHPGCDVVHSTPRGTPASIGARMIRRTAIERTGSIDAACGPVGEGADGYVRPPVGDEPPTAILRASARPVGKPTTSVPEAFPLRNVLEKHVRRLLLIAPFMTLGGADKFNLDLLDQLRGLGWEATVATTIDGNHDWYRLYEQRTPDLFPLSHFLPVADYPRFLHYLVASRRPDVVLISNSEVGYRLLPYLRATCSGPAFVDYCHSVAPNWNDGGYPRLSVDHADLLDVTITTSEHLCRWMVEQGARAERLEVCYANVDVDSFRPRPEVRAEVRRRLGIPLDEPIVLFAGRISGDKQPGVLAETFRKLDQRGVRFAGVVVGDGPDLPRLRAFTSRKLRSCVFPLGAVGTDEIAELMAAADVFFLPSRCEGIALTVYEAMASGIPVVAADVGGQSELVTDDCGVLVGRSTPEREASEYADALGSLLANPQRRRAMGAAARARIEHRFSLERMGGRMNDLLEKAIARHLTQPVPVPTRESALTSAAETVELTRVAGLREHEALDGWGLRGALRLGGVFRLLARVGGPAYRWGVARGWSWLPKLKRAVQRALMGAVE